MHATLLPLFWVSTSLTLHPHNLRASPLMPIIHPLQDPRAHTVHIHMLPHDPFEKEFDVATLMSCHGLILGGCLFFTFIQLPLCVYTNRVVVTGASGIVAP
ncbi:hypothetical protein EDB84DRAFT_644220 [Lactarius hengduanensis]|nr:hypothetical protein EDB84DRAFT_644220 [Lactarius hengduanensis]